MTDARPTGETEEPALTRHHLRIGWWGLLVFLVGGLALETLHGFKLGIYLDVPNETRRLMWRLAHAHGAMLALVNLAFALTLPSLRGFASGPRRLASRCLFGALLLMPTGFLLGGIWTHAGDPGLGVLLVPPGAVLLFIGVLLTARAAAR